MKLLKNKHIVLGITGSIAAYKSVSLASMLTKAGALVDVVMTESAAKLVAPLTFRSVTGRGAYVDADLWQKDRHVLHIELGQKNDAFLIAPATANTIAKLAHGLADNLLTVTALASQTPLLVAPAMDGGMYANPATQANLRILAERGMTIIGPAQGHLASGLSGKGRMVEPEELFGRLRIALGADGPLSGRKVVVTAGGTREPIDPVRVITNRSSGKQGYALAQAALDLGARVTLISAPTCLDAPFGVERVSVTTADEMLAAVLDAVEDADALIMAAAVADFRPTRQADEKIKKAGGVPALTLEPAPDVLGAVAARKSASGRPRLTVGFAAESQNLLENAQSKISSKKLDLIIANDISAPQAGFEVDTNRVTLLWADGKKQDLPLMSKVEVAERVLGAVVDLLGDKRWIGHVCAPQAWEEAQRLGQYRADSLNGEGFIHCSTWKQITGVMNMFYSEVEELLLLNIDPKKVEAEIRWEAVDGDEYPHIYGPLNLDAVVETIPFEMDIFGVHRRKFEGDD